MNYDKNTRYIYKVIYGKKNSYSDYEVIKKVCYIRWDNEKQQMVDRNMERAEFAKDLYNGHFYSMAGYKYNANEFKDLVEVVAYKQADGEIWLRTKADDTTKNNLELLKYAKFYNFAEKEE